uniref:Uncharacterized protein n=1 Tax=viral metagenome TaxID=1070528 RepID=A0A6M3IWV9_9ZZZZ
MASVLDNNVGSILDEQEAPVTSGTPPSPVIKSSILDEREPGIVSKIGDTYNKVAKWSSEPAPLKEASVGGFATNVGKGTAGLGVGLTELAKLELGGLQDWITDPKKSLMSLKQGPKVINDAVIIPILDDIKELFTHPVKYTYEKPIQQLLNLSIITGVGAGVKGIQEASKVSRATTYLDHAGALIRAGENDLGKVALDAAKGTMGTLRKKGVRSLSPRLESLAQELEYQRWLETYSPMTSRGVQPGITRKITPIRKEVQLGKWAGEATTDQPLAGGLMHEVPEYVSKKLEQGVTITEAKVASFRVTKPIGLKDVHGVTQTLDKGHEFTEVHLSNGKVWLHDGKNIVIDRDVLKNLPKDSKLSLGEQKFLSPEEEGIRTIIKKGPSGRFEGEPIGPKFSEYTVPGGKNYREILFQAPGPESFETPMVFAIGKNNKGWYVREQNTNKYLSESLKTESEANKIAQDLQLREFEKVKAQGFSSTHWDEPNVISHARVTDRVTPDGKKIMFIEEIQSDWAKEVRTRKSGTIGNPELPLGTTMRRITAQDVKDLAEAKMKSVEGEWGLFDGNELMDSLDAKLSLEQARSGFVRNAVDAGVIESPTGLSHPLLKKWQEFTLKKLTKQAIDEGYDGISWASGKQITDMYSLAKRIDEIRYKSFGPAAGFQVDIIKGGKILESRAIQGPEELTRFIGKDAAQKVIEGGTKGVIKGKDLEIGGEWAKNLYDKQIPNILKDLTKEDPKIVTFAGKRLTLDQELISKFSSDELREALRNPGKFRRRDIENEFWLRTQKIQRDPGFIGEFGGRDASDYEAWAQVLDIEDSENFVSDYVRGAYKVREKIPQMKQSYLPLTKEVKTRVIGDQPMAGGKPFVNPPEPSPGEPGSVFERIREQAYADAPEVIPEGKIDAQNYERYLKDKASGPIKKIVIKPEYQGDYYSLKPAVAHLSKATGDTPNVTAAIANHWMETLYAMKHPEHEQSFIAKNYKPQGDVPKFPERVYPWIKVKTKAPMPSGESNPILRKIGSPGQVMRDAWGYENPLVDAFEAGQTAGINTEFGFKWFKSLTKGIKSDSAMVKDRMSPFIKEHISLSRKFELTTDESMKKSLADMIAKNYKDANDFQLKMAETSPDIRIAMYAEDTLPATLLPRMTEKDIRIGEMVKSYYTKTAEDMKRVDLPILSKQAYTRHIIANEMKEAMGNWNNIPEYIKKHIPADTAFAHRAGEFNWYPSVTAQLTDYIPVVERKLAFQPYLIHWKDTVDKAAKLGNKAAVEAAEMIKRNIYQGSTLGDKISNGITSTNYFLQLFANARVAVKHVIGGWPGAISEVGLWNTPSAVYQMVMHPLQSQEMLKTFSKLKDIVKTLDTTSGIEQHSSRLLKALQGQPTTAVEYVESGINIMGNLIKGGNKGIDPELLRSYIWNKVTSVNFRGGWDIPKVFANPAGRIVFQYSLEPHKVWEYRAELVRRALNGEKDIYGTTYGGKLIQYIALVGATEALARAHGKTVMDTIGGTPYIDFVSPKKEFPYVNPQMKVKLGPGVKLLSDVSKDVARGDIVHVTDSFLNYVMESGVGLIGQLTKASGGKIPKYYEDAYDYLLGLPEVDRLERMNSKTTKYLKYRSEKDELMAESNLIRKNPVLKNFVLFKRDARKTLRKFLDNPQGHIQGVYGRSQASILDEE